MSSTEQEVRVLSGVNEFVDRDVIPTTILYGQIDRWIMDQKSKGVTLLNTSNRKKIEIGTKVKISDALFSSHLKLKTMIDRKSTRRYDNHAKGDIIYIANKLGYNDKSGLYKVLAPLYEIGLVDLKDTKFKGKTVTDLIVYDYPVYADSPICNLVKCREWEKRESEGVALSRRGVAARKKKKKPQSVEKSQQVQPVEKSQRESVEKSQRESVEKSQLSNDHNSTNDLNSTNDHHIELYNRFTDIEKDRINEFLAGKNIDDDLILEFLDRIYKNPPKTKSYIKYFDTVLESVKNTRKKPEKPQNNRVRKELEPEWLKRESDNTRENEASQSNEQNNSMDREEFEREKAALFARIKKYKERQAADQENM